MTPTQQCEVPVLPQAATRLTACVIKRVLIDELFQDKNFDELVKQYELESLVDGFPKADLQFNMYRAMESKGIFFTLVAHVDDDLVGFLTLFTSVLPHSGKMFGSVESFFVDKQHRKSGAGIELLRAAEELAESSGAVGLVLTAPKGGKLSRVMSRSKYRQTHETFYKGFA
jgi:GNAT superfamily N-acetyltransferase